MLWIQLEYLSVQIQTLFVDYYLRLSCAVYSYYFFIFCTFVWIKYLIKYKILKYLILMFENLTYKIALRFLIVQWCCKLTVKLLCNHKQPNTLINITCLLKLYWYYILVIIILSNSSIINDKFDSLLVYCFGLHLIKCSEKCNWQWWIILIFAHWTMLVFFLLFFFFFLFFKMPVLYITWSMQKWYLFA